MKPNRPLRQITRLALLILVTLMLGLVAVYRDISLDVTLNRRNSLSPESQAIAASIVQPVHILAFAREDQKQELENLLQRYHRCNYRITFTLYNPDRRPQLARDYHISAYGNLILQTKQHRIKVQQADEISISNGLLGIIEPQKPRITIVQNPSSIQSDESIQGLDRMKAELEDYHTEIRFVPAQNFPDSSLNSDLVILSPLSCSLERHIVAGIDTLLDHKIPVLLMLEPDGSEERNHWLNRRGIRSASTPIQDPQTGLLNPEPTIITGIPAVGDHPITAHLSTSLYFPRCAALLFDPTTDRLHPLISSSNHSYLQPPHPSSFRSDSTAEIQGPFCIAAIHQPDPEGPACLIIGDADFSSNAHLYSGANLEFLKSSVNFLLKRRQLMNISTVQLAPQRLDLTISQQKYLFVWIMIALPAALAIAGFVYLRYRKGKSHTE